MPACPPLPVGGLAEVPNRQTLLNVDIVVQCEFICCASSSSLLILLLFVVVCCCLLLFVARLLRVSPLFVLHRKGPAAHYCERSQRR